MESYTSRNSLRISGTTYSERSVREIISIYDKYHYRTRKTKEFTLCEHCLEANNYFRFLISKAKIKPSVVTRSGNFIKLLVDLCNLDNPKKPSICSPMNNRIQTFFDNNKCMEVRITALNNERSNNLWKFLLGVGRFNEKVFGYSLDIADKNLKQLLIKLTNTSCVDAVSNNNGLLELLPDDGVLRSQKNNSNDEPKEGPQEIEVLHVFDNKHVSAYLSVEAKKFARSLTDRLTTYLKKPTLSRKSPPKVGEVVAIFSLSLKAKRALVLHIEKDLAWLWTLDYGKKLQVPWCALLDIPELFQCIQPQAVLCVFKDITRIPFMRLFNNCLILLEVLSEGKDAIDKENFVCELYQLDGFRTLVPLIHSAFFTVRLAALKILHALTEIKLGQVAAVAANCVDAILTWIRVTMHRRADRDNLVPKMIFLEREALVHLLYNLCINNEAVAQKLQEKQALSLLQELLMRSPVKGNLQTTIFQLQLFLGSDFRSLTQSSKTFESVVSSDLALKNMTKKSYSKLADTHLKDALSKTSLQVVPRVCNGSLTSVSNSRQHHRLASPEEKRSIISPVTTDIKNEGGDNSGRFYIKFETFHGKSDETHELRHITSMKHASIQSLSKIMCSFLNTGKACTVYYGIYEDNRIHGMYLDYSERDMLRLNVSGEAQKFRPCLQPFSISVNFIPVIDSLEKKEENCFVVEISVVPAPGFVYTLENGSCYLRVNETTQKARTNDLRQWVAAKMEEENF